MEEPKDEKKFSSTVFIEYVACIPPVASRGEVGVRPGEGVLVFRYAERKRRTGR